MASSTSKELWLIGSILVGMLLLILAVAMYVGARHEGCTTFGPKQNVILCSEGYNVVWPVS